MRKIWKKNKKPKPEIEYDQFGIGLRKGEGARNSSTEYELKKEMNNLRIDFGQEVRKLKDHLLILESLFKDHKITITPTKPTVKRKIKK